MAHPIVRRILKELLDQGIIFLGCLLVALGLDLFFIPNRITAGGVSGIATILFYTAHLPVGLTMLALNAVLFVSAWKILGREFGFRSILATLELALLIDAVAWLVPVVGLDPAWVRAGVTKNLLLATIYGGIVCGVGGALVYMRNASTGGTDILARIVNKFTAIPMGKSLLMVDTLVTVGAGFVFGAEAAMFAIIAIYVSSRSVDMLLQGLQQGRQFLIISEKTREIAEGVLGEMGRGATFVHGIGAFTGEPRSMLMVVIRRKEFLKLKELIRRYDPHAFVMVTEVSEILGEGFGRLM